MKIPNLKKIMKRTEPVVLPVAKKAAPKKVAVKKVIAKKVVKKVGVVASKSAAKKAVPKKAVAKKAVAKKAVAPAPLRLVVASDSESFWTTDGKVLNSLPALADALKVMTKSVYSYHLSDTGSDFADWVETVLAAPECATHLRKAKTAKAAQVVVMTYLKQYKL